jgi:Baseplate J-like protein
MPVFVEPTLITDPTVLAANAKALMESELPGWKSSPGDVEDVLIDAFSIYAGQQAEVLKARLIADFRELGSLINTPPINARPATSSATFTMVDAAGYTVEAGAVIGLRDANNELQAFRLPVNLVVPAASTTGVAVVEALEPGIAANNLSGKAELISTPPFVKEVVLGTSGGGLEAEEDSTFLDRLAEALALQKPAPVLAPDAAVIARSIPGVFRACGVDLLKPAAGADRGEGAEETPIEKCVTVACAKVDGTGCGETELEAALALLVSLRELNFKFFTCKPHYTRCDVTTTVSMWPGQEKEVVKAAVKAALEAFLSPARWATGKSANPAEWVNDRLVRQSELFSAVAGVPGVRWCSALTFGKTGALGTADFDLKTGASVVPALPKLLTPTEYGEAFNITVEASS